MAPVGRAASTPSLLPAIQKTATDHVDGGSLLKTGGDRHATAGASKSSSAVAGYLARAEAAAPPPRLPPSSELADASSRADAASLQGLAVSGTAGASRGVAAMRLDGYKDGGTAEASCGGPPPRSGVVGQLPLQVSIANRYRTESPSSASSRSSRLAAALRAASVLPPPVAGDVPTDSDAGKSRSGGFSQDETTCGSSSGESTSPSLGRGVSESSSGAGARPSSLLPRAAETMAEEDSSPNASLVAQKAAEKLGRSIRRRRGNSVAASGAAGEGGAAYGGSSSSKAASSNAAAASSAAVDALCAVRSRKPEAFLVDNSQLKSTSEAISYRRSKRMEDKSDVPGAPFGGIIFGVLGGDGWLRVSVNATDHFLPAVVRNVPVLKPLAEMDAATIAGVPGGPKLMYVAQFGNNSPLIRQIMRMRQGWASGPGDPANSSFGKASYEDKRVKVVPNADLPEVQFLWTQFKSTEWLEAMATGQAGLCVTLNEEYRIILKPKKKAENGEADQSADGNTVDGGTPKKASLSPGPTSMPPRAHNHFEGNGSICTKNGLRETMLRYYVSHGLDPFGAVPMTFVIENGIDDPQHAEFRRTFDAIEAETGQAVWLAKPGEWANRGFGIRIYNTADEITERVNTKEPGGGALTAYWYREAYLRTTSVEYTTKTLDRMVHLNNDAVQKKGEDYGKFESANKLSLDEFQRYLDTHHAKDGVRVQEHIVAQMRGLMADTIRASAGELNPRKIDNCFEIFGFDFMVDVSYRVWLIEVNTNPCLELAGSYLTQLIPKMVDEGLQIALDSLYNPAAAARNGSQAKPVVLGAQASASEPACLGGWDVIFKGPAAEPSPKSGSVFCPWVPALPSQLKGKAADIDVTVLGREILNPPAWPHMSNCLAGSDLSKFAADLPQKRTRRKRVSTQQQQQASAR
eukprot:TRINITY_DN14106_c0_g1_i2.p1 TRINITY_DN14106_c0_g1~~TRINITY_DN14106_c0_g1_i2.p1  ORF type:complete len:930 (+),score=205.32 TRINITY_DN14106_c0_g1_i2:42-2792(+)